MSQGRRAEGAQAAQFWRVLRVASLWLTPVWLVLLWFGLLLVAPSIAAAVHHFGRGTPEISCAVLNFCDITLEAGERIHGIQIGDAARWHVDTAISGGEGSQQVHVVVKPKQPGLSTPLMITTDRRTYHVRLRSGVRDNTEQLTFVYSDAKGSVPRPGRETAANHEGAGPHSARQNLDFGYRFSGDEELFPDRVYTDGQRTYIEMPFSVRTGQMPALMVIGRAGGVFSDDELEMVNYRLRGSTFVIDGVIGRMRLMLGSAHADIIHE